MRLDRTIQSKGKASTPKWHATYIKRIRPSSWCPVTAGILRLGGALFDKASSTAALIYRRSSVSCRPIGRVSTSFLKVVKEQGRDGATRVSNSNVCNKVVPLVAFPSSTAIKGMMAPGDLPAPKADRRFRPARPVLQAVTAGVCVFSATLRHNLRAGRPKSSTAASPLVESQAL